MTVTATSFYSFVTLVTCSFPLSFHSITHLHFFDSKEFQFLMRHVCCHWLYIMLLFKETATAASSYSTFSPSYYCESGISILMPSTSCFHLFFFFSLGELGFNSIIHLLFRTMLLSCAAFLWQLGTNKELLFLFWMFLYLFSPFACICLSANSLLESFTNLVC